MKRVGLARPLARVAPDVGVCPYCQKLVELPTMMPDGVMSQPPAPQVCDRRLWFCNEVCLRARGALLALRSSQAEQGVGARVDLLILDDFGVR